jgi:hypothetical protein
MHAPADGCSVPAKLTELQAHFEDEAGVAVTSGPPAAGGAVG